MVAGIQTATPEPIVAQAPVKLEVRDLSISYGNESALSDISLDIREHEIFGIIGPANAGKTSFLKTLNRMDMFDSKRFARSHVTPWLQQDAAERHTLSLFTLNRIRYQLSIIRMLGQVYR